MAALQTAGVCRVMQVQLTVTTGCGLSNRGEKDLLSCRIHDTYSPRRSSSVPEAHDRRRRYCSSRNEGKRHGESASRLLQGAAPSLTTLQKNFLVGLDVLRLERRACE